MDADLVNRLISLNRDFYTSFADGFSATRTAPWVGFARLLPYLPDHCRVLDIGCGNGRLAHFLDGERRGVTYLGLDFSPRLLDLARQATEGLTSVAAEFRLADITRPDWTEAVQGQQFDGVLALAVLQHIPSFELRSGIVRQAAVLLRPGGVFAMSNWQFTSSERLAKKIVPWSEVDIDPRGLEQGDYLLDWRRGRVGYRYCHLVEEEEVGSLAAEAGLEVVETFRADGREGNLNLYAVLSRPLDHPVGCARPGRRGQGQRKM